MSVSRFLFLHIYLSFEGNNLYCCVRHSRVWFLVSYLTNQDKQGHERLSQTSRSAASITFYCTNAGLEGADYTVCVCWEGGVYVCVWVGLYCVLLPCVSRDLAVGPTPHPRSYTECPLTRFTNSETGRRWAAPSYSAIQEEGLQRD